MSAAPDPLRRLASERGRALGELGMRPEDDRWVRREAETIAGLVKPEVRLRLPRPLERLIRRLRNASR